MDSATSHELFDAAFRRRLDVLKRVVAQALAGRGGGGRSPVKERGGRVEFAGHRGYVPGDDTRALDWNAYARLGKLVLKEFEAPRESQLLLVLDRSASMRAMQKDRHALRLAAALGWLALRAGARVACVTAAGASPWVSAPERFVELLTALQRLPDQTAAELARAVERAPASGAGPRSAVLLSDGYEHDDVTRAVAALRRRAGAVTWGHVVAPDELRAPDAPNVELVDAETGERQRVALTPAVVEAFAKRADQFLRETRQAVQRHGASYASAGPEVDLLTAVERVLGVARGASA